MFVVFSGIGQVEKLYYLNPAQLLVKARSLFWKHFFSRDSGMEGDTCDTLLAVIKRQICPVMCKQTWDGSTLLCLELQG